MRWGGRIAAAIEILNAVFAHHRPAADALRDWGKAHRFAGSGDRHAIGTLVYDVLRKRNSLAAAMGDQSPRSLVLAALRFGWGREPADIAAWLEEEHGPGRITEGESAALTNTVSDEAPAHIAGDFPGLEIEFWAIRG